MRSKEFEARHHETADWHAELPCMCIRVELKLLAIAAAVALASCGTTSSVPIPPQITTTADVMEPAVRLDWPRGQSVHRTWDEIAALRWPAPQTKFKGYPSTVQDKMWSAIYADGGTELYCRTAFDKREASARKLSGKTLSWEHAMPADNMAEHFGYTNRECKMPKPGAAKTDQAACYQSTGDMTNLWPAYLPLNSSRGNLQYSELPGEGTTKEAYQSYCADFERSYGQSNDFVEPTSAARGDVARSIAYMHFVYGLPITAGILDAETLVRWINEDPPDSEEMERERRIRATQGTWNPLILPAGPDS